MNLNQTVYLLKERLGHLGGLEKYTWRIAHAFAKKGCPITILTSNPTEQAHDHPLIHFHALNCQSKLSVLKLQEFDRKVSRYLANNPSHIVFGMDRTRYQTHLRLGSGIHRAFLQTRRHTDSFFKQAITPLNPLHRLILSIEKQSIEHPKLRCLFTNSHMVKKEVLSYYTIDPKKIHVIHNGVEWHELQKEFDTWIEKKTTIAAGIHIDPTTYHFLFIGNGYQRKGLDVLLQALSLLDKEDFHLSVLGKEKNLSFYINKTQKLGLSKKVSFYGQRSDVRKFYQLCDCLVIPSFYDPFANVTVEALAMGLFVISSKSNGGHEVLTPTNGLVIETLLDPACLAKALKQALAIPKTWINSQLLRNSVKHLDFSNQTTSLVNISLNS